MDHEQNQETMQRWLQDEIPLKELQGWSEQDLYQVSQFGYSLYLQGRFRESAVIFKGLLALDPSSAYYRRALASLCLQLGVPQEGILHLDWVLTRNSGDRQALAKRCEAYLQLGRLQEARQDLAVLGRLGADGGNVARLSLLLKEMEPE
jgi:tetratricopeptide (TPR) repeat protein